MGRRRRILIFPTHIHAFFRKQTDRLIQFVGVPAQAEALRNRYTLQVYEQTNNLQNYPVRLILALNAYDTAKDDAAREAALEKVAEVCSYFDVMRSNLESVYSETRFMEQPEGFISDLNHHNHLASKTNNSDWWYYSEIPMVKKVRAWMK